MKRWFLSLGLIIYAIGLFSGLLFSTPALANGENYTYSANDQITASGGSFLRDVLFVRVTTATPPFKVGEYAARVNSADVRGFTCSDTTQTTFVIGNFSSDGKNATLRSPVGTCGTSSVATSIRSITGTSPAAAAAAAAAKPANDGAAASGDIDGTCYDRAGALSWVLCPLINLAVEGIGLLSGYVINQLKVSPLSQAPDDPLYQLWQSFRNLANIAFVLVFLVVIFASGLGLSAYNVKKILPRLVAATILVQASYFLCGLLIDVGNVTGAGIAGLISAIPSATAPGTDNALYATAEGLGRAGTAMVGSLIAVVSVIIAAWFAGGAVILLLVVALAVSLLGVFVSLAARQLVLVILIAISPLALLAWVLPNTESLFKYWYKNLTKLILMYPLIVLILSVGGVVTQATSTTKSNEINNLLAALVPIIAFFSIPATFKMGGSIMGQVGTAIQKRSSGWSKGIRSSQRMKDAVQRRKDDAFVRMSEHRGTPLFRSWHGRDPVTGDPLKGRKRLKGFQPIKGTRKYIAGLQGGTLGAIPDVGSRSRIGRFVYDRDKARKQAAGYSKVTEERKRDWQNWAQDRGAGSNPTKYQLLQGALYGIGTHERGHEGEVNIGTADAPNWVALPKDKEDRKYLIGGMADLLGASGMPEAEDLYYGKRDKYTGMWEASKEHAGKAGVYEVARIDKDGNYKPTLITADRNFAEYPGLFEPEEEINSSDIAYDSGARQVYNPKATGKFKYDPNNPDTFMPHWTRRRDAKGKFIAPHFAAVGDFDPQETQDFWQRDVLAKHGSVINAALRSPAHGAGEYAMENFTSGDSVPWHSAVGSQIMRILDDPRDLEAPKRFMEALIANGQKGTSREKWDNNDVFRAVVQSRDSLENIKDEKGLLKTFEIPGYGPMSPAEIIDTFTTPKYVEAEERDKYGNLTGQKVRLLGGVTFKPIPTNQTDVPQEIRDARAIARAAVGGIAGAGGVSMPGGTVTPPAAPAAPTTPTTAPPVTSSSSGATTTPGPGTGAPPFGAPTTGSYGAPASSYSNEGGLSPDEVQAVNANLANFGSPTGATATPASPERGSSADARESGEVTATTAPATGQPFTRRQSGISTPTVQYAYFKPSETPGNPNPEPITEFEYRRRLEMGQLAFRERR